ncbi:MAG: 2-C-methyl-D-erythritol 4-phosphate cytidylyltransferase [Gammaproteobacteria bacterium]|nr:2-C-methyl-D-erythritol 4-phosphate cytidylyltransferase [Gammaproteobacteria bacterium]
MAYQKHRYFCIIAAAGVGQRMGTELPKQYLSIANRTLLEWSLEPFLLSPKIERIVVVLAKDDRWFSQLKISAHPKITTTVGGAIRYESVLSGLHSLSNQASDDDWVIVHDAARPNFSLEDLQQLIEAVGDHPVGGLLGTPSFDSLKRVNQNNIIESNVPREGLWRAFAPQMFRYGLLVSSHQNCLSENFAVTDESSAIAHYGHQPLMVLGRSDNFKITTLEDYEMMKIILSPSGTIHEKISKEDIQ